MQMPKVRRSRALVYLAVVMLLLVLGGRALLSDRGSATPRAPADSASPALVVDTLEDGAQPPREVVVHVVGVVDVPGLYRVRAGSRVADVLERAGGPRPQAALESVNLAAPVADGQQVRKPSQTTDTTPGRPASAPSAESATGPLALNSATAAELEALPGIGPVTAQKIIEFRQTHGAFRSVEELDAIPGIGPARIEQVRKLVTV
ncbi:MAG: ComEA family DNA-binding protein [Actinomycetia bacterium]|nr:ComEA family DNA-binding protein [Actinomycetes bacterium]